MSEYGTRPGSVKKWFLKSPSYLYRARLGFLFGSRFLMLEHRGRSSGTLYETPLEVSGRYPDRNEWIVTAGNGPTSDWYLNLRANGAEAVWIRTTRYPRPTVRFLEPTEAADVMKAYETENPRTAAWLRNTMGVSFDGTDEGRVEMMKQIPMVSLQTE